MYQTDLWEYVSGICSTFCSCVVSLSKIEQNVEFWTRPKELQTLSVTLI